MGRFNAATPNFASRALRLLAGACAVLALCGCGGIEFQGKVFDYAGLSGATGAKPDPRMTERAPLMIPPDQRRLPPPGAPAIARADWPVDSDVARKQVIAAKEAEAQKREASLDPSNPYAGKPTLLDKMFGKSKGEEEEREAVPEPDPSDKTPQDRAKETAATHPQKAVNHSLNAPTPAPEDDPFHRTTPESYDRMSNPKGNDANY